MEKHWEQRIEKLEEKVAQLSKELAYLKAQEEQDVHIDIEQTKKHTQIYNKKQPVHIKQEAVEEKTTGMDRPGVVKQEEVTSRTAPITEEKLAPRKASFDEQEEAFVNRDEEQDWRKIKPKKSIEESIMSMLPKIFMVILILGVLWGLKLASDYGFLTDGLKIFGTYALSIGIGVGAAYLEKKKRVANAIVIAMYGGTFILGILATAAGAIMYELLSLTVALVIALLYIAYGIMISYLRKNEALTGFVLFTSLLLPYLLEYMEFNSLFIAAYIVMIFTVIQFVIWKHLQHIAFYIGVFFSFIALQVMWETSNDFTVYFAVSFLIVTGIFLISWTRLYEQAPKKLVRLKEGALFTLSGMMLFLYNRVIFDEEARIPFLVAVLIFYVIFAYFLYNKQLRRGFDVGATFAMIVIINIVFMVDAVRDYRSLIFVFTAFAGMMLAIRLRAPVMKVMNGILLAILVFSLNSTVQVNPFFQVDHMALLLTLVAIITTYIYAKQQEKETLTKFEEAVNKYHLMDIILGAYVIFVLMYIIKLDYAYISLDSTIPYIAYCLTAIATVFVLALNKRWTGKVVPIVLLLLFFGESSNLGSNWYWLDPNILLHVITYIVFIGTMVALLADFYAEGKIYTNWQKYLNKHLSIIFLIGMLFVIYHSIGFANFLFNTDQITYVVSVIWSTLTLFIVASLALVIDRKKQWKVMKNFGYILLFIALFKLIFMDLADLDLLIRAILFISIGAIGMVLSGRLLKKDNK